LDIQPKMIGLSFLMKKKDSLESQFKKTAFIEKID
jgi:hypothetical protein